MTVALLAMALHTMVGLLIGWPYPSVATFVTGVLAVIGCLVAPRAAPHATGGLAALTVFFPTVVPVPLLAGGLAGIGASFLVRSSGPLRNAAIALPSLTLLAFALTL